MAHKGDQTAKVLQLGRVRSLRAIELKYLESGLKVLVLLQKLVLVARRITLDLVLQCQQIESHSFCYEAVECTSWPLYEEHPSQLQVLQAFGVVVVTQSRQSRFQGIDGGVIV